MNVYKFSITKTVFVEASNKNEAKELLQNDEFMMVDEKIDCITVSSRSEMRRLLTEKSEDTE